jgi:aerobic-type carbon monoxide dehydrogenase small subunit (CoxS/CutS family)
MALDRLLRRIGGDGQAEAGLERQPAPRRRDGGPTATRVVRIDVNGEPHEREVEVRRTLGDFLREDLDMIGTHFGCEHGVCGACTVQVDGEAVRSCLMLAVQADGRSVKTIEGMAKDGKLHPIQQAFWDHKGQQCGYCTPGMILATEDFLRRNPNPTRDEIREGMSGNICRCTGYQFIVDSIVAASEALRREEGHTTTGRGRRLPEDLAEEGGPPEGGPR